MHSRKHAVFSLQLGPGAEPGFAGKGPSVIWSVTWEWNELA